MSVEENHGYYKEYHRTPMEENIARDRKTLRQLTAEVNTLKEEVALLKAELDRLKEEHK